MPPFIFFFFNDPSTTEIYTLSLHDALPISGRPLERLAKRFEDRGKEASASLAPAGDLHRFRITAKKFRSEEHTSELQSRGHLVCRLLLEKKKNKTIKTFTKTRPIYNRTQ